MNMHNCPHCNQPGITALRKICLGPACPATCKACGQKITVPYWSVITILPMLLSFTLIPNFVSSPKVTAIIAVFMTMLSWTLWESLVPLIKNK